MERVIEVKNKDQDGHAWRPAAKARSAQEAMDFQNYSRQYAPDVQVRIRRQDHTIVHRGDLSNVSA